MIDTTPDAYRRPSSVRILPPVPWLVGEHMAVIGSTGSGKTTLMSQIVKYRQYVSILRTKPDDVVFRGFKRGYNVGMFDNIKATGGTRERPEEHLLIDLTKLRTLRSDQSGAARAVFDRVWEMGRWTFVIDETFWVQKKLGLMNELEMLMTQARSSKISVVCGMQRPSWVTRFALSEPTHVFCFRLGDADDLKTIQRLTSPQMRSVVQGLPKYHFAHFHRLTGEIRTGIAQELPKTLLLT